MTVEGSMSVEDQRKQFGLTYDGEKAFQGDRYGRLHDDRGNIWYKDSSGETKYLGQVPQFARGSTGKGGVNAESSVGGSDEDGVGLFGEQTEGHHTSPNNLLQRAHDERHGGAENHNNGFNSINDLAATLNYLRAEEPAPVAVAVAEEPAPVAVAKNPAVKKPIAGVDYPTGPVNDAIERIRAHNQATHDFTAGAEPNMIQGMEGFVKQSANPSTDFNAEDWIAKTSRPDTDQQDHAQSLVDKWTSDIANNLQPDPQSVVNALTTAFSGPNTVIPGKLGVYS